MRKTRLFIGHNPELTNGSLEHSVDSSNNPVMEGWNVPAGNTFETDPNTNYEFLVPYSDNANGDYAVTQDIGVTGPGVVELEISVWFLGGASGLFRVQIGDARVEFYPWLFYNVIDWHNHGAGIITGKFVVTQPDPVFGYKLVIRGAGGGGIPGTMPVHRGLRYIKLLSYDTFYQEVDLYDELDIPVTYNVADVRDISKKDSNFSLTVSLPNTNNNAQLFDCIHEITKYGSGFEMLKQYPAYVEVDNNRTFEGYLKLTKVVIDDGKEVSYECNLYSNFIEFVKRLGITTLRGNENSLDDLSFSEYTTTLTGPSPETELDPTDPNYPTDPSAWGEFFNRTDMSIWQIPVGGGDWTPIGSKTYGKDFYITFIDKFPISARDAVNINHSDRTGYVPFFFDETTPFLFYKEIWDKIFEWVGFSYVSDFIEDNNNTTPFRFDHLVYPATSLITGTNFDIFSTIKLVDNITDIDIIYPAWDEISPEDETTYYNVMDNQAAQVGIEENPSGITIFPYEVTIPQGGVYSLKLKIPFQFGFIGYDKYFGVLLSGNEEIRLNDGGNLYDEDTIEYSGELDFVVTRNGVSTVVASKAITKKYKEKVTTSSPWNRLTYGRLILGNDTLTADQTLYLESGDILTINFKHKYIQGYNSLSFPILAYYHNNTSQWRAMFQQCFCDIQNSGNLGEALIDVRLISDYSLDCVFDPTVILNPKRKKVDFINDIIKKFNLYVEDVTNKKDANGVYYRDYTSPNIRRGEPILRIEPRPMYYDNQYVVKDWTSRVDTSSIEFQRIDDYIYKWLDFNDKDDKTYHVEDYNNYQYTEGEYGEEKITSPMNTSEDEKTEIKTSFGQTMCGLVNTATNLLVGTNTYLQAPYIFTLENNGEVKKDKEYEDRILFLYNLYRDDFQSIWNKSGLRGWKFYRRNNANINEFTPSLSVGTNVESYNLLDTFNAPFGSDTADLNFGWANWYYQNLNGTWAARDNCYNVFYKDMVEEYNDPSSRMMTCEMYLTPADIRDVRLSDVILVNDVAYHINKISQWKNGDEPVKVELIKIINSRSKWKPNPKGPAVKRNDPPKFELIAPVKLRDDLAAVGKLVEENTEAIAGDKTAIDAILKTIANLDARLKKLEGDGGTSTDPTPSDDGSSTDPTPGDDGSGTIKDDEEKPHVVHDSFRKESPGEVIPPWKMKMTDYPWYKHQQQFYSGYSHTGSPISKSSNIN